VSLVMMLDGGPTVKDHDAVGEVGGHDKVVFHDERRLFGMQNEPLDGLGADQTLLRVKIPIFFSLRSLTKKQGEKKRTEKKGGEEKQETEAAEVEPIEDCMPARSSSDHVVVPLGDIR
jgi:hypothetical protein